MKKEDLKSLVTQLHDNLIDSINAQDIANKSQVVNYLKDAGEVLANIHENETKFVFDNAYKEIANDSISSYQDTNEKFEQLTQMHEDTLNDLSNDSLDIPNLSEKFHEIQNHMIDEVKKANDVITKLVSQVETLERDATVDSLTKVFNRRSLDTYLFNICSNQNIPYELHLIVLDIDDFKVINDTFGHIAGDKVLIFLANILKKTLRDGDKIFRFGGEEFVLVLNRIDTIHCQKTMMRLLELVSKNKLLYKGESIGVTISMGTTMFAQGDTPESMLSRADKALFTAKENGKNRIHTELADGN